MADLIAVAEVAQWIASDRLHIDRHDYDLVDTAKTKVYAAVDLVYDTSTWVDRASTPDIIRKIISLLVASYIYNKAYADSADGTSAYGNKLERMADSLLEGVIDGTISLVDEEQVKTSNPAFWPDDTTGSSQQYDAAGIPIGDSQYSEDHKFTMGMRF